MKRKYEAKRYDLSSDIQLPLFKIIILPPTTTSLNGWIIISSTSVLRYLLGKLDNNLTRNSIWFLTLHDTLMINLTTNSVLFGDGILVGANHLLILYS